MTGGLVQWQKAFAEALDYDHEPQALLAQLGGCGQLQGIGGVEIYRNNTRSGRAQALESIFPVILRVLGDACFAAMARDFARGTPSLQPDLNLYGAEFPAWLGQLTADNPAFADLPWLEDVARLEWALHHSYYLEDDEPADLSPLEQDENPGELTPRLSLDISLLMTEWPVLEIWQAHQQEEVAPLDLQAFEQGTRYLLIRRDEFRPQAESIPEVIYRLLSACLQGRTINQMSDDPELEITALGELVARGWILGFSREACHVQP